MEPAPVATRSSPWFWLIPLAVAFMIFGGVLFWVLWQPAPDSGIELGYRVNSPEERRSERSSILKTTHDVARRRVQSLNPHFDARLEDDLLILKLPGATAEDSTRIKKLFRGRGELHLSMVAPIPLQEQFNKDKVVPEGYKVVENPDHSRGEGYEAYGSQLLVRKAPVIEGRHIVNAEPRQEMVPGGDRWVTSFEMNAEGAKLFDEAAETLYNMRPPGLIAILLDGVLKSAPAVQSPVFRGQGQISGAKGRDEAKDLAIILRSGALPVPLGEPEVERPFGPKKK